MSWSSYQQRVAGLKEEATQMSNMRFRIGDCALEIAPMRLQGDISDLLSTTKLLSRFADDLGVTLVAVERLRWTSARWPAERRRPDVPHHIHQILAHIPDDERRFHLISRPPVDPETGVKRWTLVAARRAVSETAGPSAVEDNDEMDTVYGLLLDEEIATQAVKSLLRSRTVVSVALDDVGVREGLRRAQEQYNERMQERVRRWLCQ
jgi:hypothetical protein